MHYFRVDKRYWSISFERIRKAGFRIISTAVPWNLHEENQGEFDFSGRTDPHKDLVVFLELSREFGFKIILRPGPWIKAQWPTGGIPKFVFKHPETAAKTPDGKPLPAKPDTGIPGGMTPSYLHTRFQILLRHYLSAFTGVVKNYIYPRGPVFLIEIDHETSYCGNFDPYSGDYNEYVVRSLFPRWLEERYGEVSTVNKSYKAKYKEFGDIEPPTVFDAKQPQELLRHLDWIAFRESLINRYADSLTELLSAPEMSAMFIRGHAWNGHYSFPDLADAQDAQRTIFSTNISVDHSLAELMDRMRATAVGQDLPLVSSFGVGRASEDPEQGESSRPITERETKRQLLAGLASGAKGMIFSMFVGRDHWYGAPLSNTGTIGESYDIIKTLNLRLAETRFDLMTDFADIGLVRYRPYVRHLLLPRQGPMPFVAELMGNEFSTVSQALIQSGHDYRIPELTVPETLAGRKTLIVPLGEYMSAAAQTTLVDLLRDGVSMVFFGVMPSVDEHMQPCDILAKALSLRTNTDVHVATVETAAGSFPVRAFGSIRRVPTRARKTAKSGTKTLAASGKVGKTPWHFMTFNPATSGNPAHGLFFDTILNELGVKALVGSSDANVSVVIHADEKAALLYIIEMSPAQPEIPEAESQSERVLPVIVRADVRAAGLKGKRFKLVELLSEEERRVSPTELANGVLFELTPGDSRLYQISRG